MSWERKPMLMPSAIKSRTFVLYWTGQLISIANKGSGILGPVISSLVIAFWGLQWAYWTNPVSYLGVIAALISMHGHMMSIPQIFFREGLQLGGMESGLVAQTLSIPFSIISGGVGSPIATWVVVKKFPQLWKYNRDETIQEIKIRERINAPVYPNKQILPFTVVTNDTIYERILAF
jgi:hypothetical protein